MWIGTPRFADFQHKLGIARNILSDRLAALVRHDILRRHRYSERPPREEYRLTDKGRDLYGITVALMRWGDRWLTDGPPLALMHRADGGAVEQILRCSTCHALLDARDIAYDPTHPAHAPADHATS